MLLLIEHLRSVPGFLSRQVPGLQICFEQTSAPKLRVQHEPFATGLEASTLDRSSTNALSHDQRTTRVIEICDRLPEVVRKHREVGL